MIDFTADLVSDVSCSVFAMLLPRRVKFLSGLLCPVCRLIRFDSTFFAEAICEKLELAAKTAAESEKEAVKNADADRMMSKEREDALEKRLEACVLRGEEVSKERDKGLEREKRLEEAKRAAEEKWGVLEREKSEIAEQRGRSEAGRRAAEERAERAEEKCRNLEEKLEYVEIR
jgi:hypothetical protein